MSHQRVTAVFVGLSIFVGACGATGSGAATVAPTSSSAATSPAASHDPFASSLSRQAGTFVTGLFKPAFRFTVPAGWSTGQILNTFLGADESASGIALTNGGGVIVVTSPSSIYPPAPGDTGSPVPADLLATLAKDPKLTLGPTSAVTIGGLAGMQVEGIVKSDVQTGQDSGYRISDYLLAKPGNHVRLAVIVVGGQTVVVMTSATPADWAAFATTADAIIGSIALVP